MTEQRIFRKVSLERLSSPEQLDQLMKVTDPKSWLAFLGLAVLLLIAIYWSFMGRIPIQVSAPAVLMHTGGIKNLVATEGGQLVQLHVNDGDLVEEGQLVAEILPLGQSDPVPLYSFHNGRILELQTTTGSLIMPGQSLASLENVGEDVVLEAILYLSPAESQDLTIGMPVEIIPTINSINGDRVLQGTIVSVSQYPATKTGMLNRLGSEELVQSITTAESPIEVKVTFDSFPEGLAQEDIRSGTFSSARILTGYQRPIDQVIPLR